MINIAIDGPSGAGKSTLAKALAKELGYIHTDTGALYRTVGLAVRRAGISPDDKEAVIALLPSVRISLRYEADGQKIYLDGEDVGALIRTNEISSYASKVSAIPEVRAFLLELQRGIARENNVIMDGRDIGTVVLPNATVKIYLTASAEARAQRRWLELHEKGDPIPLEQVLEDVQQRDYNDTHRDVAPLRQAEDAVLVDTTECDLEESYQLLLKTIRERI